MTEAPDSSLRYEPIAVTDESTVVAAYTPEPAGDQGYQSEAQLEEVRSTLREAGVEHEVRQLVRGLDPADDLVNVANELEADIIVIGLRRRSPVGKLILGSNAQRVLLDAPCPVLAVKASE